MKRAAKRHEPISAANLKKLTNFINGCVDYITDAKQYPPKDIFAFDSAKTLRNLTLNDEVLYDNRTVWREERQYVRELFNELLTSVKNPTEWFSVLLHGIMNYTGEFALLQMPNKYSYDEIKTFVMDNFDIVNVVFVAENMSEKANYETYETLGDSAANNVIKRYLIHNAGITDPQVLTNTFHYYSTREAFSELSNLMGISKHIMSRETITASTREDVFEACMGALVTMEWTILRDQRHAFYEIASFGGFVTKFFTMYFDSIQLRPVIKPSKTFVTELMRSYNITLKDRVILGSAGNRTMVIETTESTDKQGFRRLANDFDVRDIVAVQNLLNVRMTTKNGDVNEKDFVAAVYKYIANKLQKQNVSIVQFTRVKMLRALTPLPDAVNLKSNFEKLWKNARDIGMYIDVVIPPKQANNVPVKVSLRYLDLYQSFGGMSPRIDGNIGTTDSCKVLFELIEKAIDAVKTLNHNKKIRE